ncbi:toprim domain-containing protein [Virgibacillus salexigens]|uniref:toprim domain-containing protein n=1 Tax=Virgibacillus massiliensis TaxID=1462526 RepID=UPI001371B85D|nr:toprim domain-containing protein [Virgibacillus massiliensis]MYL43956.1 DUF3991 domain-containing protein [Virgibacillus massiliensis]
MRVSKEEIDNAREVPLIDFIEANGIGVKQEGKYHRLVDHDSLVIKGNNFTWNSQQKDGYGAISFAMMYYDLKFPEAVKRVNDHEYSQGFSNIQTEEMQAFKYPKYFEVDNTKDIKDYLVNERKIDSRVVDWCIKKELLVQDKKANAVFKWKDNKGKTIGADRQGTQFINNKRGTFKQIIPNSKEDGGFSIDVGKPNKIALFESPIDMLSYWSIRKREVQNTRLLSMSGLKMQALSRAVKELQQSGHTIDKIVSCVDRDKAGNEFHNKLSNLFKKDVLVDDRPKHAKDWNDELKNFITKSKSNYKQQPYVM